MRLLHSLSVAWLCSIAAGYTSLSEASLKTIPGPGTDFDIKTGALLSPILIPRVPGTPGSTKVLNHFVDFFQQTLPEWTISFQNSTSTTPTSKGTQVPFRNLIVSRDPPWAPIGDIGRLTLVAHYDSLSKPEGFLGAIDSAAPCAMIMHVARSIDAALTKKWADMEAKGISDDGLGDTADNHGIQILFLDGEEAFLSWTDEDSLYGARSLAEEWETTQHAAMSAYSTPLQSIELFVLLDLLGAKGTVVPSYFKTTHWAYEKMAGVEKRMRDLELLKTGSKPAKSSDSFLFEAAKKDSDIWLGGHIGDDHVPFMKRGVNILHLIPSMFPPQWHTIEDDGEHLDSDSVEDWAKIVTAFAAEWMDLEGFMDKAKTERPRDELHAV